MKKYSIILLLFLFQINFFAQVGFVEYDNSVYRFLKRMNSLQLITNYNEFHLPKTRSDVAEKLIEVSVNSKSFSSRNQSFLRISVVMSIGFIFLPSK